MLQPPLPLQLFLPLHPLSPLLQPPWPLQSLPPTHFVLATPASPLAAEPEVPETEVAVAREEPEAAELEPGFRQRGRIRRRAGYLRRLREVQLRDIGGFMLELHRFERDRPDLVMAKVDGAARTDTELRALQRALGEEHPIGELSEAGIGGACQQCGAVHGSGDRFCASCGEPLNGTESSESPEPEGSGEQ